MKRSIARPYISLIAALGAKETNPTRKMRLRYSTKQGADGGIGTRITDYAGIWNAKDRADRIHSLHSQYKPSAV
jgi:hypothetical protein